MSNSSKRVLSAAIILAAVALCYGGTFHESFHYDDIHTILKNPSVRSLEAAAASILDPAAFSAYRMPMIRPFTLFSYARNYAVDGFRPVGWRLIALILHALAALLVKSIVEEIFRRRSRGDIYVAPAMAGLAGGLLFAVHPLQVEAVNYMSARSVLLMAVFYLLTIYLYLRARNPGLLVVSWATFILALLSREDAATLPAAIIMADMMVGRDTKDGRERFLDRFEGWLPYWCLLGAYFLYRRIVLGTAISGGFVRSIYANLKLQVWAVGIYQKLLVYPAGFSISHPVSNTAIGSPEWVAVLVLLGVEFGIMVLSLRKLPVLSFSLGWCLVALSPSVLIPLNQVASEHRTYLAMMGPALLFGSVAASVAGSRPHGAPLRRAGAVMVMALSLLLAFVSRGRSNDWLSDKSLWRSAVEVHPLDEKSWILYGIALKEGKDYKGAMAAYRRAIAIEPSPEAYNNLGVLCGLMGDFNCSRKAFDSALSLNPDYPNALFNVAELLMKDGDLDGTEAAYRHAIKLRPVFPEAHRNLAIFLFSSNRGTPEEIAEHLALSLQQDPYQEDADQMRQIIKNIMEFMQQLKKTGQYGAP